MEKKLKMKKIKKEEEVDGYKLKGIFSAFSNYFKKWSIINMKNIISSPIHSHILSWSFRDGLAPLPAAHQPHPQSSTSISIWSIHASIPVNPQLHSQTSQWEIHETKVLKWSYLLGSLEKIHVLLHSWWRINKNLKDSRWCSCGVDTSSSA